MSTRVIAIGDIHGCAQALAALVRAIAPGPQDTLVFLGDYIDRGPDSRDVLDQLLTLRTQCQLVPLLGNHELMLLDALENPRVLWPWLEFGGDATLASYGGHLENIPLSHWQFLSECRRYYETATHFFVHANYAAELPLAEQPDYLLFWEHLHARLPGPHCSGKRAVVGHTSQKSGQVLDLGYLLCIDTYCYGGGWLTAWEVHSGQCWQADRAGQLRAG
jgi:serine/threonine protein phosphatase 1